MRSSKRAALFGAVTLLGTAAVLTFTVPASAEKGAMTERHKEHMEKIDTDGNGKVSKAEAKAAREAHFKTADMDGNGSVSLEEFEAMAERRRQMKLKHKFERSDKNGDGVLTADEMESGRSGHFEKMGKHRRHWFKGHGPQDHGPDEG